MPLILGMVLNYMRPDLMQPMLDHIFGYVLVGLITVMEILWERGDSNVHDVVERLGRPLAYTTVMTLLDRLARKGTISRRKVGRAFVYAPGITRISVQRIALREFLAGFFDGSEQQLLELLRSQPPAEPAEDLPAADRLDAALL